MAALLSVCVNGWMGSNTVKCFGYQYGKVYVSADCIQFTIVGHNNDTTVMWHGMWWHTVALHGDTVWHNVSGCDTVWQDLKVCHVVTCHNVAITHIAVWPYAACDDTVLNSTIWHDKKKRCHNIVWGDPVKLSTTSVWSVVCDARTDVCNAVTTRVECRLLWCEQCVGVCWGVIDSLWVEWWARELHWKSIMACSPFTLQFITLPRANDC